MGPAFTAALKKELAIAIKPLGASLPVRHLIQELLQRCLLHLSVKHLSQSANLRATIPVVVPMLDSASYR